MVITDVQEKYFTDLGAKLAAPSTGQKVYWKILNKFLYKCMIPRIPPLFVQDEFITNCKENASIFNIFFSSQYTPLSNDSELPTLRFCTNSRISDIITGVNAKKAHGPDNISVNMLKLCGEHLCVPLQIVFDNILETGIFPEQWKEANVTPVHKKNGNR